MASKGTSFTTPVGRLVMGSLYKPNTKDAEGNPLVVKNGPNIGKDRVDYYIAIAIPKGPEPHWAHTPWGAIIWQKGHEAFPQAAQSPSFAWKVEDGDSAVPNKKGKKPCDNEGWRGNWILKFSGGFAPKVFRAEGAGHVQVMDENYVKPGYFIQVNGAVDGNGSQSQPGVFLNHSLVAFSAYGPEINFGPNVAEAGFGQSPLPAGATLTPPVSAVPMPATGGTATAILPPAPPVAVPVHTAPAPPIPVTPNPQFLQVPAVPTQVASVATVAVPTPPAPVSPSNGPQMTAKAGGASYASFIAGGWTDAMLVANGYLAV